MDPELNLCDDDHYLLIDDTDEDITRILTIACEPGTRPCWPDAERGAP